MNKSLTFAAAFMWSGVIFFIVAAKRPDMTLMLCVSGVLLLYAATLGAKKKAYQSIFFTVISMLTSWWSMGL